VEYLANLDAIQEGLRLGQVGVWRWKLNSQELAWTSNLESVHRLPAGSFDGTLSSFQKDIHPDDVESVWGRITAAITTGEPYRAVYRTAPRDHEEPLWIESCGGLVTDSDGTRYLTGICTEVTERVRNERELQRRLIQQRAVAEFGSFALSETDFQKVLDRAVLIAAEVLAAPLTKVLKFSDTADHLVLKAGLGWQAGLVGQATVGIDQDSQAGFTLSEARPVIVADLQSELRFRGPKLLHDHGVRSGVSVVIPGANVRPFGVFGVHSRDVKRFDATDAEFLQSLANIIAGAARQAAAADQHKLLDRETAHRAGNMLQLVISIASQTFSGAGGTEAKKKAFIERLRSLSRANHIVAQGGWTSTRFKELVEGALAPFGDRLEFHGRDILLPPELCFDMGLILHEIATNAVKYGSLGSDAAKTVIRWELKKGPDNGEIFQLIWEDLAAETRPQTKWHGFGSRLVSALVERKWSGTIRTAVNTHFILTLQIPVPK
jgi:two-component sensor histidine kinase